MRPAESNVTDYGAVIITGGSSGIGLGILKGFRRRYPAALCINISRSRPPLDDAHRIVHIEADLGQRSGVAGVIPQVCALLEETMQPVLLVHSSGIGQHARFQEADTGRTLATIDLNIAATVQLTHGLLPVLQKRGGCIATVSSTSAFQPTSMMATYGASKAFLMHWTLALGEDLRGTGVRTLALCPGGTETPFLRKAGFEQPVRSYWPLLTVDQVADAFFCGLERQKALVTPGWINRSVAAISKLAPIRCSTRVATHIMRRAKV